MILPSWPVAMWGLDILGPSEGTGTSTSPINKFTKYPEATLMVKINKKLSIKFIKSIVYRFGVLNKIITDNGS
jgi:hypothetical protein